MRLVCPAIDEFGVQGVLGLVPAHWWVELCFSSWVSSFRALGSQSWLQFTVGWGQFLTWLAVGSQMSHSRCPHTVMWGQIPELLAESSKVSQTKYLPSGTLCWNSVAPGDCVGLLVGGLFPGMADCKAGVTVVAVVCLLVGGAGSWGCWLQGPGVVHELVFWGTFGWGCGPGCTRAVAYPLMGKIGPG